jgi:hypothetical protein
MECPEGLICYTEEEYEELLTVMEEHGIFGDELAELAQPAMGDAEAVATFTWELLFLTPWELAYIALPMSVLATYGLTIYFAYKWIQKKFS